MASPELPRTRRSMLRTAAAGAAGIAAGVFVRPAAVLGTTGVMSYGANNVAEGSSTTLISGNQFFTLEVDNAGAGMAISAFANAPAQVAVYGRSPNGYALLGDTGEYAIVAGVAGIFGRDSSTSGLPAVGAAGSSVLGTGVVGYQHSDAHDIPPPTFGAGVGVYGFSPGGTGVVARSTTGTAIKVVGKATFSRSGRVSLPKGMSYVDIDLTAKGGLAGSPLCFATILSRRAGVHVESIRPNYPSAGKLRIDLNKVASTTGATTLCWVVLG